MNPPIPVLSAAQAAAWDERSRTREAIPGRVLMENAGRAVAQVALAEVGPALAGGVLLAAGTGNNGGDGWVAARALAAAGFPVRAVEVAGRRSPDCEANRALALSQGVALLPGDAGWPASSLVIDAILGTGTQGPPRGEAGNLARRVRAYGAPVIAVDGPTGLDLTSGAAHDPVPARLTVTFGGLRRGHLLARETCGTIIVADIGFGSADPAWPRLADDRWARAHLPAFRAAMHKGDRGRVLVVGGEDGMVGAAVHAARAALLAGAGLVRLAAGGEAVRSANETLPDALTLESRLGPEPEPDLLAALSWADAVVLGPGLGRSEPRRALVAKLLDAARIPVVIDADALHLGGPAFGSARGPRVLTPHAGEFAAAFPALATVAPGDRFAAASDAALASGCVVLFKGVPTVVADAGAPPLVVAAGTPGLATGGSGDVLAGFIGAFLARDLAGQAAAALGALALGRAAELAAETVSARATRPADVLAALPALWKGWGEAPPVAWPVLATLPPPALV